jgi:uncharacterized membrane protein
VGFHIGIIAKGLFDAAEILSGLFMLFMTPERMQALIDIISKRELIEDPNDFVMNYIVSYSHVFTLSTQHFTSFYLLTHGAIKMIALFLLWQKKLWAYPVSCVLLFGFIVLQLQRFSQTHSIMLLAISALDLAMIFFTVLEYRNIRGNE